MGHCPARAETPCAPGGTALVTAEPEKLHQTAGDAPLRGYLRPCLLLLLAEQSDHGYDLFDRLQKLGLDSNDHGGTYRTLRSLERLGLVTSRWDTRTSGPARRDYALTALGQAQLDTWVMDLENEHELLHNYLARYAALRAVVNGNGHANGNGHLPRAGASAPPAVAPTRRV